MERGLRRREAIVLAGGVGLAALLRATGTGDLLRPPVAAAASPGCVLAPEVTEGPYWIANHLTRRNIKDGRPGLPLTLDFTVQDATTCKPIKAADVEVWHADAGGTYSGVNGNTKRFLRGHQKSDANGKVRFDTVFPGWYPGRSPHIHLKVHVGGSVVHTGQVFFDQSIADAIYRTGAYASHGQPDTTHAADSIYAQAGGSRAAVKLRKRRKKKGYVGALALDVKS
jgi:intradiol ring-cleaving dioxygenase-like protein